MIQTAEPWQIELPPKFKPLLRRYRYKVFWGGRGAAKSWSIARALICIAHCRRGERIGCFRELQSSIKDSVHQLLCDQIFLMGLGPFFEITQTSIRSRVTGSEFIFKGLRHNIMEIKSMEGISIAWVEEAQLVTKESWNILIPTIRRQDSEIWVSFNPVEETDDTYQRFVVNQPPDSIVIKVGWQDNKYFTDTQNKERLHMLKTDPDAYSHVWDGNFLTISEAIIFKGHYSIEAFEPPTGTEFRQGADWGFAQDPTALIQMYLTGEEFEQELWINREAYGVGVEIDETPTLFKRQVPGSENWPIYADCSRPETISYVRRKGGFSLVAAEKWDGCVEDGIAHIKAFKAIHVHERCKHTIDEFRLYQYKRDRVSGLVLPIIVDKNNHCCDAIRYALDGYIQRRGLGAIWEKLGS